MTHVYFWHASLNNYYFYNFQGNETEVNAHSMKHIHEVVSLISNMKQTVKQLENDQIKLKQEKWAMEKEMDGYKQQVMILREEVGSIPMLRTQLQNATLTLQNIQHARTESDSGHYSHSRLRGMHGEMGSCMGSTYSSRDDFMSLVPRVHQLEQEMRYIKPVLEDAKSEMNLQRSQLAGYIDTVQTMQESVTRHAVNMEEIKLRQDILDVKTVSGVFIWKIPEINRRFRDAQEKRTLSLYSPPFHTSPHGYRMCIRAYLNGDGSGKGTHISMFFVLMKSEHDNLLKWPFERPVTFELINQENRAQSISETFMPDKHSPSFQQPKSEMNVASGFPRFVPHNVLHDQKFTNGDAIYIRCKIDLSGLVLE